MISNWMRLAGALLACGAFVAFAPGYLEREPKVTCGAITPKSVVDSTRISLADLKKLQSADPYGRLWQGAENLELRYAGMSPVRQNQAALLLISTSPSGSGEQRHFIHGRFDDLKHDGIYRIGVWAKPDSGTCMYVQAYAPETSAYGMAIFDLVDRATVNAVGALRGYRFVSAPLGWSEVEADMPVSGGSVVLVVGLVNSDLSTVSDPGEARSLLLGGIEMELRQ